MRPRPTDQEGGPIPGWWESYFDRDFLEIYRSVLPETEPSEAADAIMEATGARPPAQVLDLACGWGRHSLEIAERGFRVTGVDVSSTLLAEAAAESGRRGIKTVEWVVGDMRDLPFRGGYDLVLSLFSSLGYSLSDEDDLRTLRSASRALLPGGSLVLETMHRDLLAREFVEHDWWDGPDGEPVWVEREFDAVEGVSREWLRWGRVEKYHEIRVRSATEWAKLFDQAGLQAEEWLGGWDLAPFSHDSERLIVIATPRS